MWETLTFTAYLLNRLKYFAGVKKYTIPTMSVLGPIYRVSQNERAPLEIKY